MSPVARASSISDAASRVALMKSRGLAVNRSPQNVTLARMRARSASVPTDARRARSGRRSRAAPSAAGSAVIGRDRGCRRRPGHGQAARQDLGDDRRSRRSGGATARGTRGRPVRWRLRVVMCLCVPAFGRAEEWCAPDRPVAGPGADRSVRSGEVGERGPERRVVGVDAIARDVAVGEQRELGVDHVVAEPATVEEAGVEAELDRQGVRGQDVGDAPDLGRPCSSRPR